MGIALIPMQWSLESQLTGDSCYVRHAMLCRDGGMGGPVAGLPPGDGDLVQHLVETYRLEGMQTQLRPG